MSSRVTSTSGTRRTRCSFAPSVAATGVVRSASPRPSRSRRATAKTSIGRRSVPRPWKMRGTATPGRRRLRPPSTRAHEHRPPTRWTPAFGEHRRACRPPTCALASWAVRRLNRPGAQPGPVMDPWRSASSLVWFIASSNCSGSAVRKSPPTMPGSRSLCNPSAGAFRACRYLSGAVARYRSFEPTGTSPADLSTIGTGARIGLSPAAQVGPETVTLRCRSLRSARLGPSEPLSLNMPAGRITPIGASQDLREMSVRQVARRTINYLPSASSIPESAATSRPASTDFATATFSKPPMRW